MPTAAARSKAPRLRRVRFENPEPALIVIGEAPFVGELNAVLTQRFGMLTHEIETGAALGAANDMTAAIVLVSGLERRSDVTWLEATCRVIRSDPRMEAIHVLGVVPQGAPDSAARRLYRSDIHAVVEWPTERENLTDFLIELLAVDPSKERGSTVDAGLARTTRTKLAAIREHGERISAQVRDGVAYLAGQVASLPRRDELEEEVSHIPGVRGVVARELAVATQETPDAKLAREVRHWASLLGGPDRVSVSVRRGEVHLSGFVAGGADRKRLDWTIRNLPGVRSLRNEVKVASGGSKAQRLISRKIAARVADRFPRTQVEVRTFGRVVELRGTVQLLAERRAIEAFAESLSGVERVVNKLIVQAPVTT